VSEREGKGDGSLLKGKKKKKKFNCLLQKKPDGDFRGWRVYELGFSSSFPSLGEAGGETDSLAHRNRGGTLVGRMRRGLVACRGRMKEWGNEGDSEVRLFAPGRR